MNFCTNNTLLSTIHFKLYRDKEKTSTNRSHTVWQHDEDCLYQPKHELMHLHNWIGGTVVRVIHANTTTNVFAPLVQANRRSRTGVSRETDKFHFISFLMI